MTADEEIGLVLASHLNAIYDILALLRDTPGIPGERIDEILAKIQEADNARKDGRPT